MAVTLKNQTPLIVPPAIRRQVGLSRADRLEFRARGAVITITAKAPSAAAEYTPEQRRVTDAHLAEAKKGRIYGPFHEDRNIWQAREIERTSWQNAGVPPQRGSKPKRI